MKNCENICFAYKTNVKSIISYRRSSISSAKAKEKPKEFNTAFNKADNETSKINVTIEIFILFGGRKLVFSPSRSDLVVQSSR